MNRRQLFATAVALTFAVPATALARGMERVEYSQDAYEKALASGEPLLLDFFAEW